MEKGSKSNKTGNQLERTVVSVFSEKGFEVAKYRDWKKNKEKYGKELLLVNVPFTTIYNHDGNTEFLLISERYNTCARIECKWQQVSGSVDEKITLLVFKCY